MKQDTKTTSMKKGLYKGQNENKKPANEATNNLVKDIFSDTTSTPSPSEIEKLKELATAEIREYSDDEIMWVETGFSDNHLMCNRGKYCDFVQNSRYTLAYLKPSASTHGEGKLNSKNWSVSKWRKTQIIDNGDTAKKEYDANVIAETFGMKEEREANARLIAESKNMYLALKQIADCDNTDLKITASDAKGFIKIAKETLSRIK